MKPIAGLNRDVNPIDQPPNSMRYAANGLISESTGLAENIRDDLFWTNLGDNNAKFLGQVLGDREIYVFRFNFDVGGGQGEIWRYNPDVAGEELVLIDPTNILELDEESASGKILQFVYQEDFESHEVFAWAGQTRPKLIDIGGLIEDFGIVIDLSTTGLGITDFLLYPEGELHHPTILKVNDSGGKVISGAWMFCYRYVYKDLSTTGFSGMSAPAYVYEDDANKEETIMGDDGGRPTGKSVAIDLHIDPNQSDETFVQVGYISIRDGVIFAGILHKVPITGSVSGGEYVYTGDQPLTDLGDSILELITPKAIYTHIGTITSLTSRIYAACLTAKEEVDVQNVANGAITKWFQANNNFGDGNDFKNKDKFINAPSFGPGDVYALYLHVNYLDGTMSRGFHIPGRKWVTGDTELAQDGYANWQLYDTVMSDSSVTGNTGYWVNLDEKYPDTPEFVSAKDVTGPYLDNIRHHRMPTFGWMFELGYVSDPKDILMFNIDVDIAAVPFPAEVLAKISGWSISFAKRSYGDMLNVSAEVPTPYGSGAGLDADNLVSIPSPHAYGTRNVSPPVSSFEVLPDNRTLRFHGLHFLTDRPAISPKYFVKEATAISTYFYTNNPIGPLIMNSDLYTDIAGIADQFEFKAYKYGAVEIGGVAGWTAVAENLRYRNISDHAYIKNAVKITLSDGTNSVSIDNNAGEDCLAIYSNDGFGIVTSPIPIFGDPTIETIMLYGTVRQVPSNVCSVFSSQVLINPISVDKSLTTLRHNKGDTWGGAYQFNATGVIGGYEDPLSLADPKDYALLDTTTDEAGMFKGEGSKITYITNAVSPINHLLQQADPGDLQSYIRPILGSRGSNTLNPSASAGYDGNNLAKAKGWYMYDQNIYESFTFIYNDDFHRYSEYFIYGINDGYYIGINSFPTVIAFSLIQPTDSPIRQWRNWLLNNKYVQPSEKGKIINLQGAGNQMLYIHHRYSLYTTKDRIAMQTNTVDVIVGSSDIFQVTPYEIVSVAEGHTGISNRNYQSLSPFGYSWIQIDHGKVYSHDGQKLDEMSGRGMRIFFRDNIFETFPPDNDEGYYIINDDLRRRVIVGLNHNIETAGSGMTIAYSTTGQFWSFFQDMELIHPIIARDKRVFMLSKSLDKTEFFAVAEANYDNLNRQFIVEMVMNDGTSAHKYLQYIKWNTNVWENNVDLPHETFNKLIIYSDTKIYGGANPGLGNLLEFGENLFPYEGFPKGNQNARRLEDNWSTNDFRDIWDNSTSIQRNVVDNYGANVDALDLAKEWHEKSRMRDKYLIVRLHYEKDNTHKIEFESLEFGVKPSFR